MLKKDEFRLIFFSCLKLDDDGRKIDGRYFTGS